MEEQIKDTVADLKRLIHEARDEYKKMYLEIERLQVLLADLRKHLEDGP